MYLACSPFRGECAAGQPGHWIELAALGPVELVVQVVLVGLPVLVLSLGPSPRIGLLLL